MSVNIFETIHDGYDSMEQSILMKRKALLNKDIELKSSIKQVGGTVDSFATELLTLMQQDMSATEATENVKQVLANFKTVLSSNIEDSFDTFVKKENESIAILDALVADSVKNRSELEKKVMSEISKLNETSKYLSDSLKSIKQDSVQNYQEKCKFVCDLFKLMFVTFYLLHSIIGFQNQKLHEKIAQLKSMNAAINIDQKIQQLTQSLDQISQEYNKNVQEINQSMAGFKERIDIISSKEAKNTDVLTIKTEELVNFVEKDHERVAQFLSQVDQLGSKNYQNISNKCTGAKKVQAEFEVQYAMSVGVVLENIENTNNSVNQQLTDNVNNVLIKSFETKTKHVSDFKAKISDLTTSNDELSTAMVQMVSENDDITLEKYKSMQSYCDAYRSSQKHQIKDCEQIGLDCVERFETYQVTGVTPKKTTYSYPKELACTSPHERILARIKANIRKEIDCSSDVSSESGLSSSSNEYNENQKSPPSDNDSCGDENVQNKPMDKTFVVTEPGKLNGLNKAVNNKHKRKHLKERN